ncbi:hypothetical protein JOM56_011476 [Amanita muscaria]
MSSLLAFDHTETVARVRSVTDAQKLIDIIDLLNNNETFLSQCGRDAARKAALLASEIYARVPLLPWSVSLIGPTRQRDWISETRLGDLELMCSSAFISRILDHNYILPKGVKDKFVDGNDGNVNEQRESVDKWLKRSSPNFVTRIRVVSYNDHPENFVHAFLIDA